MVCILAGYKVAYFPAPKVACTSLKHWFFFAENGFEHQSYIKNGREIHIHSGPYISTPFDDSMKGNFSAFHRFCVVRDPVRRFLSCFSNRVVHHDELSENHLRLANAPEWLVPRPSLAEFVENIENYQLYSASIAHHTAPLVSFLGREPAWYDEVFSISEIERFREVLGRITGKRHELKRHQTGGPKISTSELSANHRSIIEEIYSEDREVFGAFFE